MDPLKKQLPSSFKDPAGFVFMENGTCHRQINPAGLANHNSLMQSGLYQKLSSSRKLIAHEDVSASPLIIRPTQIPFISYPYEWSFSMLKDAALLTLDIQIKAIEHQMSLKDGSAFNVQFLDGAPIFIDTLSFEKYPEGKPWAAYGQFCRHFLGPLALMAHTDISLNKLLTNHIDGIPLDLVSKLLPFKTKLSLGLQIHIHAHGRKAQTKTSTAANAPKRVFSKMALLGLLDSLQSTVKALQLNLPTTVWGDYYSITNYNGLASGDKRTILREFLQKCGPNPVIDLGANDGTYSAIAAELGHSVLSADFDPVAVEKNYLRNRKAQENRIHPLYLDLTNPTPALGWAHTERPSFTERVDPDSIVLALALVHHLAIGYNLPLEKIVAWFAKFAQTLILEFVPKEDSQVIGMLRSREDIFVNYTIESLHIALKPFFDVVDVRKVDQSERVLLRCIRKS
jgi:hypothetical protein